MINSFTGTAWLEKTGYTGFCPAALCPHPHAGKNYFNVIIRKQKPELVLNDTWQVKQ